MSSTVAGVANEHVDYTSSKSFDATLEALRTELGNASTPELMERLWRATDWDDYAAQCGALAGPSGLIEVGRLDWGDVLTLSGQPMRACCLIIGNPLTARKLLAAGGARVGLYLPTKILVFEDEHGEVRIAYDRLAPIMAQLGDATLHAVAATIDRVLDTLARAAVS